MDRRPGTPSNAQRLRDLLDEGSRAVARLETGDERNRRQDALATLGRYAQLLDEAVARRAARYCFQLELPDGRWDVAEQELTDEPQAGDLVWFGGSAWHVVGHRMVNPGAAKKPPYPIFACAPAVAA